MTRKEWSTQRHTFAHARTPSAITYNEGAVGRQEEVVLRVATSSERANVGVVAIAALVHRVTVFFDGNWVLVETGDQALCFDGVVLVYPGLGKSAVGNLVLGRIVGGEV